jgi:adenylosuccinate lyase
MPQKRNPHSCEVIIGLCKRIKYYALVQVDGMWVEHERGDAGWYVGRDSLGEECLLMGDIMTLMKKVTKNPTINRVAMKKNLDITRGMILSEAVMFELGKSAGKQTAHELVYEAAMKAAKENRSLKDALLEDKNVAQYLSKQGLDDVLDPTKYVGLAPERTLEMVRLTREQRAND